METEDIIRTLTPALSSRMLSTEQREAFEQGLSLLEQGACATAFVRDSRRFRDYHRRVRQLLTCLQTMQTTAAAPAKRHVAVHQGGAGRLCPGTEGEGA